MRRQAAALLSLAILAATAAGCGHGAATGDGGSAVSGGKSAHIIMVTHGVPGDPFWNALRHGAEDAADDFGVKLDYLATQKVDPAEQARLIVGEDPFAIERIMKRIEIVGTWHHVKASSPGIAAVEMACWDIVGKVCGQPLVNLFGGRVRDAVDYFYYVSQRSPDEVAADGRRGAEAGFTTFYLKVGSHDPRDDIERVAALRDGAGPDAAIRVDANEAWSSAAAIRTVAEMERYGLELVEQPVSGRNLAEMAYVRGRLSTPLLANEASWTRYDQLEVIRHGAADVISLDNQMDGGLLNLKRGAGLCEVAGLPVLKHSLGELGIAASAAAHVLASTPNFTYPSQSYASLLADDVVDGGRLRYENGTMPVPTDPGIGVQLDPERVARYAELYEREGHDFGFRDAAAIEATPLLPKR